MITELTAEQELDLIDFREQWLKIGLSTKPIDLEKSKEVISGFYRRINKEPPIFLSFSSPLVAQLAMNILSKINGNQLWDQLWNQLGGKLEDQLWDQLRGQLDGQLEDQLWGQLRDQLRGQLDGQLEDQLGNQLWDQIWNQLWGQLRGQLGDQLRDQLWNQLGDQLGDRLRDQLWNQLRGQLKGQLGGQLRDQLGGQLRDQLGDSKLSYFISWLSGSCESYWVCHYLFCQKIGVKYTKDQSELLNDWATLAKNAFFWHPFEKVCVLSDRPEEIHFNADKRLHNPDKAAIRFRDGYSLYSWNGTRVPEYVITNPDEITVEKIEAEDNAEVRRVMLERYGFSRYFEDCEAELIDEKEVWGQPVKLYKKNMDNVDMGFVHVINGTVEPDGTRHKFIIPCKIIDNCAKRSVYSTYPDLIERFKKWGYNDNQIMKELASSIRT